jgi:hypothetical protein
LLKAYAGYFLRANYPQWIPDPNSSRLNDGSDQAARADSAGFGSQHRLTCPDADCVLQQGKAIPGDIGVLKLAAIIDILALAYAASAAAAAPS